MAKVVWASDRGVSSSDLAPRCGPQISGHAAHLKEKGNGKEGVLCARLSRAEGARRQKEHSKHDVRKSGIKGG